MPLRRLSMLAMVLVVAAVLVAGCGGDDDDGGSTTGGAAADTSSGSGGGAYAAPSGGDDEAAGGGGGGGGGETIKLAADPGGALKFDKAELTAKAGTVTIDLDNPSSATAPHAVEVEGNGIEEESDTIDPGNKTSVTIDDLKPGTYEFYCPVGNHKQAGMEGTLTVE